MARIIPNEKGFRVIQIPAFEMFLIGCGNICDHCNEDAEDGYYVAVLNRWFCHKCYEKWRERSTHYPADAKIEEKNFNFYKGLLGDLLHE